MIERTVAAGAALFLALSCADAAAGAHASATLSDLRIQLYAIGSTTPSVTFTVAGGSTAIATTSSPVPGQSSENDANGGAAFAAVQSASPTNAALGSFAQIAGDVFGDGATMLASAFAVAGQSAAEGSAALMDGNNYARFMLSADTVMVITATADLWADAGRPDDYAVGSIDLELAGSEGDSAQSSAAHSLVLAGGGTVSGNDSRHMQLALSFTNAFDYAIGGFFFAGVDATAVSSVPEPAGAALALVGLALVAGARRRARQA